jgi:hypothetical protein
MRLAARKLYFLRSPSKHMDLQALAKEIRSFEGVIRKKDIGGLVRALGGTYDARILAGFGEDAGVIDLGKNRVMLLSTDSIWHKIVERDPWWAGYCSVIVNINDILAMGGRPIAMVDVIAGQKNFCEEVALGMREASEKYRVPIVGGHLHPDSPYTSVEVAIIGEASRESVIYSHTAREGDIIVAAVDLEGRFHPKFPLNWDSITSKSRREIRERIAAIQELASKKLASSGKDISNPGIIGTLGMLCEASGIGAVVDLTKLPKPRKVELSQWLKVYPGFGFVLTAEEKNVDAILEVFRHRGVDAEVVGRIESSSEIKISDGRREEVVFNLKKEPIMGLPPF